MSLFRSNATPLYLHKKSRPLEAGTYDIILSPQFYWVKKVSLPVKRVSDAKRLAESVFEGSLPQGTFSYEVLKADDGDFIIIAYDREAISGMLAEKSGENAQINGVYFAQTACKDLDTCCSIDEESSLVNLNGLLMQIPRNCTDAKLEMSDYLKGMKPGSHRVRLGSLDVEVVDRRTFALMASGLLLFLIALGIEYAGYKKSISELDDTRTRLIRDYHLPPTTMQLESIRKRLLKTYGEQKAIREAMAAVAKLPLQKEEYIKRFDIDNRRAEVEIVLHDPERAAEIKKILGRQHTVIDSRLDDKTLTIKIAV